MGNWLRGRKHKPEVKKDDDHTHQDKTILKLKLCRDKLLAQKKGLHKNTEKAAQEAKQLIKEGKKDRAMFALKRKKLYENMAQDMENQYTILEKMIIDVESKVQMAQFTNILKESNDLIKELELTTKMEELHKIGEEVKEREQETREFNKLFEEHHVNDSEVDKLFEQFELEVNGNKSPNKQQESVQKKKDNQEKQEKHKEAEEYEGDEDINKELAVLA